MKHSALVVAMAAVVLAVVPGAVAKAPPSGLDVCGATACLHLDRTQAEQFWIGAAQMPTRPPRPSPFYVLRWHWQPAGPEETAYYIPAARVVRWDRQGFPRWASISARATLSLAQAADRLEPDAVPSPTSVTVGQRTARRPETYFRLLRGPSAELPPAMPWLIVRISSDAPSPWTDGQLELQLSARSHSRLVMADGWVHKVPLKVANRARRGLPLSP